MGPGNMFLAQSKGWYNIIFRWHMYNPPLFNKRTMAIFKPPLRCRISHPNSLSLQVQLWRPNFPERPFFRPWPNWSIKKNDLGFVLQDSRHQISGSINSQHLKTRCCTTTQGFLVADGTPDRESQCIHPGHASFQWDAAHSGSQRSQCKIVHFTMERRWSGMISPNDFSKTWSIESP